MQIIRLIFTSHFNKMWSYLAAFLSTILLSPIVVGLSNVNPRNISWITGDNWTAYLAQLYYLKAPVSLPLGGNWHYGLENSATITFTGPPLFLLLPQKFLNIDPRLQFFGIFLCLSIFLQILLSLKIAAEFTDSKYIGICFSIIMLTPFFFQRIQMYFWLTSHFLILWAILLSIRQLRNYSISIKSIATILTLSYCVNPYLLAMVLLVMISSNCFVWLFLRKSIDFIKFIITAFSVILINFLVIDLGFNSSSIYETFRSIFTPTYGAHPGNLLALINPNVTNNKENTINAFPSHFTQVTPNWSSLHFSFGNIVGDSEGFGYLGLGNILLVLIAFVLFFRGRYWFKYITYNKYLIFIIIPVTMFVITPRIGIGALEINFPFPIALKYLGSPFRASGRFVWVIAYVILVLTLVLLLNTLSRNSIKIIISIALIIQILDISSAMLERSNFISTLTRSNKIYSVEDSRAFEKISQNKAKLRFFPPANGPQNYEKLSLLASHNNLATDGALSARPNFIRMIDLGEKIRTQLCLNQLESDTLYAISSSESQSLHDCGFIPPKSARIDDTYLVVSK